MKKTYIKPEVDVVITMPVRDYLQAVSPNSIVQGNTGKTSEDDITTLDAPEEKNLFEENAFAANPYYEEY